MDIINIFLSFFSWSWNMFFCHFFVVVLVLVFCCGWYKYLDIIIDITGIMIFFEKVNQTKHGILEITKVV